MGWLLLILLLGAEALPGGGLFTLLAVVLAGQLVGEATQLVGMPPLIGMLLTGVVARSTNLYQVSGVYVDIVSTLRYTIGIQPSKTLNLSKHILETNNGYQYNRNNKGFSRQLWSW